MLQGMEKEIIVLSVTVNQPGSFLSDQQRLNVAITRAKRHSIIVGNLADGHHDQAFISTDGRQDAILLQSLMSDHLRAKQCCLCLT